MPPPTPRPPDRKPVQRLAGLRNPTPGRRMQPKPTNQSRTSTCPNPNCPDPRIVDDEVGKVCTGCGTIISDTNIVSEVTFGESSSGAAVVQGTYVGPDQSHGRSFGPGFKGSSMESREATERNGKAIINRLAQKLLIQQVTSDRAFQIFKLAIGFNFIQGRRTENVAAVCLYIACRKMVPNTIMLIDVSDLIKVNVFKLGRTYKALLDEILLTLMSNDPQESYINAINPEDLINRFARQLEFGSDTTKVANDATRIVQRMNRDWMTTGRRPGGICGAALILAARMNNYRRTVREVVYVVKVTEITIHQRLDEFRRTESGDLTVSQFRTMELEKAHDPPAFYKAREEKTKKRRVQKRKAPENAEEEAEEGETSPPPARRRRIDKDGFAIPDLPIDPALTAQDRDADADDTEIDPSLTSAVNTALSELEETVGSALKTPSEASTSNRESSTQTGASTVSESTPDPSQQNSASAKPLGRKRVRKPRAPRKPKGVPAAQVVSEDALESEMLNIINSESTTPGPTTESGPPAGPGAPITIIEYPSDGREAFTTATTDPGATTTTAELEPRREIPDTEVISDSEFADDPEVQQCLLNPSEIALKERIWVHENQDYLRAQQAKLLKQQLEDESGTGRVIKRRKRHKGRMGDVTYIHPDGPSGEGSRASTPGEATRMMLEKRGFSKKINYERLTSLYEDEEGSASGNGDEDGSQAGSGTSSAASTPRRRESFILAPEPKSRQGAAPTRRGYSQRDAKRGASPTVAAASATTVTPPSSGRRSTTATSGGATSATAATTITTPIARRTLSRVPVAQPTATTTTDPDNSDSDIEEEVDSHISRAADDETIRAAFAGGLPPPLPANLDDMDIDDDDEDDEDEDGEEDLAEQGEEVDYYDVGSDED